jgi:hypothetical protein
MAQSNISYAHVRDNVHLRKNSGREKVQCYKECPIQMTGFYVGLVGNGPA